MPEPRRGVAWDEQIQLDDDDIAPPDHDWLAHEVGYPDAEIDAIEAELLANDDAAGGDPDA